MSTSILLRTEPKIEFLLLPDGFQMLDEQTEGNSGYYRYRDLQSVEVSKPWFPMVARFLRFLTWITNGVPLFPNATSYKKSKIVFHLKKGSFGMWLTDMAMAKRAKQLKVLMHKRIQSRP